jgi:hypothetical protein
LQPFAKSACRRVILFEATVHGFSGEMLQGFGKYLSVDWWVPGLLKNDAPFD